MGGVLTQWASWRWVMFVNVPIGAAVIAVGRAVLPETQRQTGRFDLTGALFSTLGMGSLVYGFVRAASNGWSDRITIGAFIAGAALITMFIVTELHAEEPITPLRLLTDRSRTSANVARGLLFAGMFGLFFFLTQFLQNVLGYSALQTGFAFLPLPITVFVVSQTTSRVLVHRVHGKVLMLVGVGLGIIGFLLASQLTPTSSYVAVITSLLFFACGNGLSFVPLTSAAIDGVPAKDAGAASGLVNVTQQLGGTLGVRHPGHSIRISQQARQPPRRHHARATGTARVRGRRTVPGRRLHRRRHQRPGTEHGDLTLTPHHMLPSLQAGCGDPSGAGRAFASRGPRAPAPGRAPGSDGQRQRSRPCPNPSSIAGRRPGRHLGGPRPGVPMPARRAGARPR